MNKVIILGMLVLTALTIPCSAFYDYFWAKEEQKKKLAFANQVISEFITPEELAKFTNVEENVSYDGSEVVKKFFLPKENEHNYSETITYFLEKLSNQQTIEEFRNLCPRYGERLIGNRLVSNGGWLDLNGVNLSINRTSCRRGAFSAFPHSPWNKFCPAAL